MGEKLKRQICNAARGIFFLLLTFIAFNTAAQPGNDNCTNASVITIPNAGYGKGTFTSSVDDISQGSLQTGETFAPAILVAGQNKKSMWYKFSISTTRAVRVTLAQPGTIITAGDAGFAVYKANSCLPGNAGISTKLTPIGTFGNTYHPCVDSGQYLIQVSANNNANGPLYIELRISDTTGALYDHPSKAYDFGVVNPNSKFVDYTLSCQSVEDASEICTQLQNASQYHKSSWHTFTTPAYFDYLSVILSNAANANWVDWNTFKKFGYKLYKGNAVTTPIASLVTVDGCDSLMTTGYYGAYKMYKCGDLEPNTTYTIQLFAHETFSADIRLGIYTGGIAPSQSPLPILTASNNFGTLVSSARGTSKTLTDFLACNSRHSGSACNPALPANGFVFNNKKYNLSTFFTFTLNTTSKVDLYSYPVSPTYCGPAPVIRLFKQGLSANCSDLSMDSLLGTYTYNSSVDCLLPGAYTVQVSGTDTTVPATSFHSAITTNNSEQCLSSNLGTKIQVVLTAHTRMGFNKFSLSQPGAYDTINRVGNSMEPLVSGKVYQMKSDTFGCINTVVPPDTTCSPQNKKVMYRQFIVADSGIARFSSLDWYHQYKLYKGDANALAASQNAHTHPAVINGLVAQTQCLDYTFSCTYKNVCVTPGTYTFSTFGFDDDIGRTDEPSVGFNIVTTKHYTPALAQDMGSILDSVPAAGGSRKSDIDSFNCKDNAVPINGYTPCKINNIAATKAIYRQFYLKESALVSISSNNNCGFATGKRTLFAGKATDGLAGLTPVGGRWNCFTNTSYTACDLLPAGWYTVVSYGSGPTYENPMQNVNQDGIYGSYTGQKDEFTVTVTVCASPKYNRPYKASVDAAKQPHLIEWKNRVGSTAAYPRTDTTYSLPTESFNCVDDTPFDLHPVIACDTTVKKVAYYVFKTTRETYMEINTSNQWGMVYALDVRTDSALLATATPVQPCVKGISKIQLCRLPAGVYTLVIFAPSTAACSGVTPKIYVDQVQESRFDHANKAYDFGIVPPNDLWYRGKVGEINPLHPGRAGSNDFFSCITGSRPTDPTNARCVSDDIYNMYDPSKLYMYEGNIGSDPAIVRRNLWYTFVVDKPGMVYVKVENKTSTKFPPYRFVVLRSDVNGALPFTDVVSSGMVDSSLAQGLTALGQNGWPNYCNALEDGVSFYRDPCTQSEPQRYYVLVENRNPYGYYNYDVMNPNNQLEVAIRIDSVNLVPTKYDHYYRTYDFGSVGAGKHAGGTDNFSCATRNAKDPVSGNAGCTKTLWYKFTSTVTGDIRYRIRVNDAVKYTSADIQLFQEQVPGDSTSTGLIYRSGTSFRSADNTLWSQHCVSPGTWYVILPGCKEVNEDVSVEFELVEQQGDFCSRPAVVTLAGAGTGIANTIINCHTVGTDYGEFNPTLTCPVNGITARYKSSWFRLDVSGNDTVDVTTYISENTNVLPSDIKYRMMTGNCGAMQEQSCVLDAQTQNTYKCLTAGSYYFQVFTPVTTTPTGSTLVTGDISLHLASIKHVGICAPVNNCLANANFAAPFDCTTDSSVRFVNYSTYGSSIEYQWDFGYAGQTSTATSPAFNYPELSTAKTYTVTLKVTNTSCGGSDITTIPVTIPARPKFNIGSDTSLCNGGSITLNATAWPGSTYTWNTNATTPTITTTGTGVRTYWARVTYNGCVKTDTIRVNINTITSRRQNLYLCQTNSVQLVSTRNMQETHLWNNGETTSSIYADTAGMYINTIEWNGCPVTDTFNVFGITYPFGSDTSVCFSKPYILNATSPGATGYLWQNGSTDATFNASTAGWYWVKINYGTCNIIDSIYLEGTSPLFDTLKLSICNGQLYTLPSGQIITIPGLYNDTVRYKSGCDSLITTADISFTTLTETATNVTVCAGESYTLPWGGVVSTTGVYSNILKGESGCDSIKNTINFKVGEVLKTTIAASVCGVETYTLPSGTVVNLPGIYNDTIKYALGCDSLVTVVQLSVRSLLRQSVIGSTCAGQSYTLPSGKVVTNEGVYHDTVRYASGCDSLLTTVNLTSKALTKNTIAASICSGQRYALPSGLLVNSPGVYSDTLRYTSGCDSVINTVDLQVRFTIRNSTSTAICSGATYTLPSGVIVNTSGVYNDTIKHVAGCDSLITTTDLAISELKKMNRTSVICAGESLTLPSGTVVTASGTYSDTVRYSTGCDSLITTLHLTVKSLLRTASSASICEGETFTLPSGVVVSRGGSYNDTLKYASGCDSLIHITTITVRTLTRATISASVCFAKLYTLPSGRIVSSAGTYMDTIKNSAGCDSLISIVTLSVKPLLKASNDVTICEGQTITLPSGFVAGVAGIYNDTARYVSGCDSLVSTVSVTVKQTLRSLLTASVCAGGTYALPWGGVARATGTYSDTLRYTSGCDSLITSVALRVKTIKGNSINKLLCNGETYTLPSGQVVSDAGTYTDVIKDLDGCDSILTTIRLSADNPVVFVSKSNDINCIIGSATLSATGGNKYLWSPANSLNNPSLQKPVATPSATTTYKVQVTSQSGCVTVDSITLHVSTNSTDGSFILPSAFTPDADGKNDCFGVKAWGFVSKLNLQIFDRWGRRVFVTNDPSRCWDGNGNGAELGSGTYVYQVSATTICGDIFRKGTVVLIR